MFSTREVICALSVFMMTAGMMTGGFVLAEEQKPSPADGFTIHVIAAHKFEDGMIHGPYHH